MDEINNQQGEFYALTAAIPGFSDILYKASPEMALKDVRSQLNELESLRRRFDRDTINISVIGRAGQGKSRLLQSISGVDNVVIPADSGGDCTGAKSVICNDIGDTFANVRFFSEKELISNVQKYLDELGSNIQLGSVSQIKSLHLPTIYENVNDNKKESYYNKLLSYVEHYSDYISYLGRESVVKKEEIRGYVAQYLEDNTPVYQYLAVKEVEIHTPFVYGDAGKIMLVDTIGLGDTSIGLRDKLIETLINDSDAAILLRRPDPERDNIREEDNELYDCINEKMAGRDLNHWLFYVLNTYDNNKKTSDKLFESLNRKLGKTLQASFVKQLDCANKEVVEKELLEPLLNCLSGNLNEIDDALIRLANNKAQKALEEIEELNETLSSALSDSLKSSPEAYRLFQQLYKGMGLKSALRQLNMEYIDRNKKEPKLEEAILAVLRNITKYIPTEEEIVKRLEKGDASSRLQTVYNRICDNLRSHIRNDFDNVCRTTIKEMQEGVQMRIIQVLKNDGKLSKVPLKSSEFESEVEWLQALISEKMDQFESLEKAFNEILEYKLHIEGLLQFKVHCALDIIEEFSLEEAPEGKRISLNEKEISTLEIQDRASKIRQTLGEMTYSFAQTLSTSINELLIIPNNSFNSLIRKFREVLGYEEDSEDELSAFYHDLAPVIWKNEFDEANAHNNYVQQLKCITTLFENWTNKQDYMIK